MLFYLLAKLLYSHILIYFIRQYIVIKHTIQQTALIVLKIRTNSVELYWFLLL